MGGIRVSVGGGKGVSVGKIGVEVSVGATVVISGEPQPHKKSAVIVAVTAILNLMNTIVLEINSR